MSATFPVNWRQIFRSVAIFMSVALIVGILVPVAITRMAGRASPQALPFASAAGYVLVVAPLFSLIFALVISQWFRLASITVGDGTLEGRTYWGRKNRIPLNEITKLTQFTSNGIRAVVVHSRYHGKIYIYAGTERLGELLAILSPHVNEQQA